MKPIARFFLPATAALVLAASALLGSLLATRYQRQLQAQPATAARWEQQIRQSRQQRDDLLRRLEGARLRPAPSAAEVAPTNPLDPAQVAEVGRWVQQVKQLKQAFAQRPDQRIPELAVLSDQDWLGFARHVKLDTEDNLQRAFATVRNEAKSRFVQWMLNASKVYLRESRGVLPTDPAELRPYLDPTLDPAMFTDYEMVRSGRLSDAPKGPVLQEKNIVNQDYDKRFSIDRQADPSLTYNYQVNHDPEKPPDERQLNDEFKNDAENAVRAFAAANHGTMPANPAELLPYFDPPLGPIMTEKFTRPLSAEEQKKFREEIVPLWHR